MADTKKIRVGNNTPNKIYIGENKIEKCYVGNTLVWYEDIHDLTGYTWVGKTQNEYEQFIQFYSAYQRLYNNSPYNINFLSNDKSYISFGVNKNSEDDKIFPLKYFTNYPNNYDIVCHMERDVSNFNLIWDNNYRTIQITGGSDATNINLIKWLQENGTLTRTQTN